MEFKLIKPIRIIAYILTAMFLISAIWYGWLNVNEVRKSTNELDKSVNDVVIEWSADYYNDKELLDRIAADLKESEETLDRLFKEAEAMTDD